VANERTRTTLVARRDNDKINQIEGGVDYMTFSEIITSTRQAAELPCIPPSEVCDESFGLVQRWEFELDKKDRRQRTPSELKFAYHMFNRFNSQQSMTKPVILACPPGYGKSTGLKTFLYYTVRTDPTYGAIVVKEKIEELEALAQFINGEHGRFAYYIKGSDKYDTREQYDAQFGEQERYPIVLMSMEQLRLQTVKNGLKDFGSHELQGTNRKIHRGNLFIDERPKLTVSSLVSAQDLTKFMQDIRMIGVDQYEGTYELLRELRNRIEDADLEHGDKVPANEGFKLPQSLKAALFARYGHDDVAKLRALETLIGDGGSVDNLHGTLKYSSTIRIAYDWTVYNTFIMDGTGRFDPNYITKDNDFTVLAPPPEHHGENMVFHFCDEYLFSGNQLKQGKVNVPNVVSECERIQNKHCGQLLIVGTKDYIEALTPHFEGRKDEFKLKHYDGGRGSNDYKDNDTAIYIGNMFKGEYVYRGATEVLLDGFVEREIKAGTTPGKHGIKLDDPLVAEYRDLDQAVDFTQEINRMRANNKSQDVNIYVLNKDRSMMDLIYAEYPKARQESYSPVDKLVISKETNFDRVVEFLRTMVHGQEIAKKQVREQLGIKAETFKDITQSDELKQVCTELGIEMTRYKFKKNGGM
jgi:hypothetical protein